MQHSSATPTCHASPPSPGVRCAKLATLVLFALVITACTNQETARLLGDPMALRDLDRYYVARFEPDQRGINELIRTDLAGRGYRVTTGPESMMPQETDVLVTYWDKWMWDITMYMLELDITLRTPGTNEPIAVGHSMHASLTRRSPGAMVKEVLDNIFAEIETTAAVR